MNKKILIILIILTAFAYPALGAGTDFTVTIVDGQTMLNFSTYKTATNVQPQGQNTATSTPWVTMTNLGDAAQTFTIKFGGTNPTGIALYVASTPDFGDTIMVPRSTLTAQAPAGWFDIPTGGSANGYFYIDTTATAVNGTNTLKIT